MIVHHHHAGTVDTTTRRALPDAATVVTAKWRVRRGVSRALALSCAAVALTPAVATAAPAPTSPCPPDTRAVEGIAGTGCTTSAHNDFDQAAALAVILVGAGGLAIVRGARARAGRRPRPAAETAFPGRA